MARRAIKVVWVGFILAWGLAGPARALDVECLWRGLPQEHRDVLMTDDVGDARKAAARLSPLPDSGRPWLASCGVTTRAQAGAAQEALFAYGKLEAASVTLRERYRLTPAQIDAAWLSLPSADRDAFAELVVAAYPRERRGEPPDGKARERALPILQAVADRLNVTNYRAINQLLQYLQMRIVKESYEGIF